ncbi:MAG: hypothetical protein KTR35_18120 [Gammaproteobacteria bacterium]|nr:hypothetical protein [Gammaproteobacteria bacterium]
MMNKSSIFSVLKITVPTCALLAFTTPVNADDTDVFTAIAAGAPKPNVLFILDYSGSMKEDVYGDDPPAAGNDPKIDILKTAVTQLLDENAGKINIGLGSLYKNVPSGVKWPISDLTADANMFDPAIGAGIKNKDIILSQLNSMGPSNATATVNALVEGALYFRGGAVLHNDAGPTSFNHQPDVWDPVTSSYTGGNDFAALPASYTPKTAWDSTTWGGATGKCYDYSISGGSNGCASHTVIAGSCVFQAAHTWTPPGTPPSSGEGWSHPGSPPGDPVWVEDRNRCDYQITGQWTGANYESPINAACGSNFIVLISDGKPTRLLDNTALNNLLGHNVSGCADLSTTVFGSAAGAKTEGNCGPEVAFELANNDSDPSIPGSHVNTYTVGFAVETQGKQYLEAIATNGNGRFFPAENPAQLTEALNEIIDEIIGGSENFVQLALDIDRASFSHDNKVYFPLFSPSGKDVWAGNVKGYFLDNTGLVDINGAPAIDSSSGIPIFAETAQSFWSDTADGNDVGIGGASEQMSGVTRTLLTHVDGALPITLTTGTANDLTVANTLVTPADLGLAAGDTAKRDAVLTWLQDAPMGDPLHTQPVPITYSSGLKVVYTSTNQGFIHAIDASNPVNLVAGSPDTSGGDEIFAFMPPELLANLPNQMDGTRSGTRTYGLDGGISRWHDDTDGNGIVDPSESVLLVIGMRRGGMNYYALDVSDPYAPRYLWRIQGGSGSFSNLAQTWSQPSLITVKDTSSPDDKRRVMIFGGGYDTALDYNNKRQTANGNAIYVINQDGTLAWSTDLVSGGVPGMNYSIPSELTVIDSDQDEKADRIYVGDVGGNLWRVDFDNVDPDPSNNLTSFEVHKLADLFGSLGEQPFFYPPSVATIRDSSGDYLSVSIGSGDRTNPTDMFSTNAFFMIKDPNLEVGPPPGAWTPITLGSLYDATSNDAGSTNNSISTAAETNLQAANGWYVQLQTGEKSLSRVVTFDGNLLATTFQMDPTPPADECSISTIGRFYMMNVKNATPVLPLSESGLPDLTTPDRFRVLPGRGIPSAPAVIFPPGTGEVAIMVDKEIVKLYEQKLSRVFWHSK